MSVKQLLKSYFPVIIVLLFLLMRLPGLGRDMANSDALRWYHRSGEFSQAIKTRNFRSTYQHYQPGVTLMWISSVVNFSIRSLEFSALHKITKSSIVIIL